MTLLRHFSLRNLGHDTRHARLLCKASRITPNALLIMSPFPVSSRPLTSSVFLPRCSQDAPQKPEVTLDKNELQSKHKYLKRRYFCSRTLA
ncbi:hypothetical protein E2C01_081487 [Portunus trituberculatus]|uniref:Uncharacterized protein n=1 Tax=Portunus trituberculatus TaxID=210409 RepID=A0A5B7IPX5_PORTR|nr:hypothetical protein [Portunus trituberculatus]